MKTLIAPMEGTFRNIRVYCTFSLAAAVSWFSQAYNLLFTLGLAFIVYWGIVLFGYDTYALPRFYRTLELYR
jgi:hypothetical protein